MKNIFSFRQDWTKHRGKGLGILIGVLRRNALSRGVVRVHEIMGLPVIDGHCHPFDPAAPPPREARLQFEAAATGPGGQTLLMLGARSQLNLDGEPADLLQRVGIAGQVVDFGWPPLSLDPETYARAIGLPVRALCRLETLCDEALATGATDVREVARLVSERVEAALTGGRWAGLKSIAAYETGLSIRPMPASAAQEEWERGLPRAQAPSLNNYLLLAGLRRAAELGAVVQFHTGIGARFLPPHHVSPWPLLGLLEQEWMAGARVVVLHAGYPHVTEAGRLTALFANVYCDISIMFPFSFPAHLTRLKELLAFAPFSRVTFGSDGCFEPERYAMAAFLAKRALAELCGELVRDGYLSPGQAFDLARSILHDTAANLYGFGGSRS